MGAYDAEEHDRRERKNSEVGASFDDERDGYEGDESAQELLDQFEGMQSG